METKGAAEPYQSIGINRIDDPQSPVRDSMEAEALESLAQ